jgi:hypothetical protein
MAARAFSTGRSKLSREALSLYRDALRMCRVFTWNCPQRNVPFRGVLEESARSEMEKNRTVTDEKEALELIVDGRAALFKMQERLTEKAAQLERDEGTSPFSDKS